MPDYPRRAFNWFRGLNNTVQAIIVVVFIFLVIFASGALAVLALFAAIGAGLCLAVNLSAGRSIQGWGIMSAASVAGIFVFGAIWAISGADLSEPSTSQTASGPDQTTEEATEEPSSEQPGETPEEETVEVTREVTIEQEPTVEESPEPLEEPEPVEAAPDTPSGVVTIRVSGAPGVAFSGSYGNLDGQTSVDGVTPDEYEIEMETGLFAFDAVSTTFQKQGEGTEELTVEIISDGEIVQTQSTTAAFGVVSTTWDGTD